MPCLPKSFAFIIVLALPERFPYELLQTFLITPLPHSEILVIAPGCAVQKQNPCSEATAEKLMK